MTWFAPLRTIITTDLKWERNFIIYLKSRFWTHISNVPFRGICKHFDIYFNISICAPPFHLQQWNFTSSFLTFTLQTWMSVFCQRIRSLHHCGNFKFNFHFSAWSMVFLAAAILQFNPKKGMSHKECDHIVWRCILLHKLFINFKC